MRVHAGFLLLAAALTLAACAPAEPVASESPIAQAGAPPPAGPIKLTLGGFYGAAAGFTTRGNP